MKKIGSDIRLSASDLVAYLNCNHLTELDVAVLEGKMHKPDHYDPLLEILRERGRVHETSYLEYLRYRGLAKNTERLYVLAGFSNMMMARKYLVT